MIIARTDNLGLVLVVLLLGVNERHALDKTAFSCISLFAGAFPMHAECMPEHVLFPSLSNGFMGFRMNAHSFNFFGGAFGNACRCQTGSKLATHDPFVIGTCFPFSYFC
jgi:hypothetical protein